MKAFSSNLDTVTALPRPCFQLWEMCGDMPAGVLSSLTFAAETFEGFTCIGRQGYIVGVHGLILPETLGSV